MHTNRRKRGITSLLFFFPSVWFTDGTTGKETYQVGRYVDVGEAFPDPDHKLSASTFNNALQSVLRIQLAL